MDGQSPRKTERLCLQLAGWKDERKLKGSNRHFFAFENVWPIAKWHMLREQGLSQCVCFVLCLVPGLQTPAAMTVVAGWCSS